MRLGRILQAIALISFAGAHALPARAQSPDSMMPDESTVKAKQLIQQAIQALGGPAYLGVKDSTCTGRFAQFGHNGDLTGYTRFLDQSKLPFKERTEFGTKHNLVAVSTATEGWDLDRGGVQEATADTLARNQERQKKAINVLLRDRLNEPGLSFRWGGSDLQDLRRVEWVEITDSEHRTMRVGFDQQTRLPSRVIYQTRDPVTHERNEEIEYLSNYHSIQGVTTPLQIARDRNGIKFFQAFFEDCSYNTGLDDSLFTRASLEERFAQLNKGKKPK